MRRCLTRSTGRSTTPSPTSAPSTTEVMKRAADWSFESEPGLSVGEKITADQLRRPVRAQRQGQLSQRCLPTGRAGHRRRRARNSRWSCLRCPDGGVRIDPAVLVVCRKLGIDNVFRVNGPAGVAALGFGTESIPQVRKIVGPGSPPVACAQVEMQRYGVATMMILGPTESMVIADDSADPRYLAADLLNEAEHGTDSSVVLVTTSEKLRDDVDRESAATDGGSAGGTGGGSTRSARRQRRLRDRRRSRRGRRGRQSLGTGTPPSRRRRCRRGRAGRSLGQRRRDPRRPDTRCSRPATTSSVARPVFPTGGFAHVSSGITADAFLKRTAVARADAAARRRMTPTILAMSRARRLCGPRQRGVDPTTTDSVRAMVTVTVMCIYAHLK